MELRHLRYFVAVVEEGSFNRAATLRLHTAQPSLSRQIGDLEDELGVQLVKRSSQGLEPTAAGRAFLDHARLILAQVNAASEVAKRAGRENQVSLAVGIAPNPIRRDDRSYWVRPISAKISLQWRAVIR